MSFTLEHLDSRTPGQPALSARADETTPPVNYWPLVRTALIAAALVLVVKAAFVVRLAQEAGADVEMRFFAGFVPYFSVELPPREFAHVVTESSLAMAVAGTVGFAVAVLSTRLDRLVVWGWFVGVIITVETVGLEWLRHSIEPPVIEPDQVWRTYVPIGAAIAIAAVYFLIPRRERRDGPDDPSTGSSPVPIGDE